MADKKKSESTTELAGVNANEKLAEMYRKYAHLGSENLGGITPLLKIHATNRSTTNELAEGGEPHDGWFFYRPTGEQFKEVECHILTISRGFRTDGMKKKNVFNQLMAGVVVNDNKSRPFIMYLTGLKLSPMWEFAKEASKYRQAKPTPIPLFALKVKLTTKKETREYGPGQKTNVWILQFEIEKEQDGTPKVIADIEAFQYLRTQVSMMENIIEAIIEAKSPEETEPVTTLPNSEVSEEEPKQLEGKEEKVNVDDIPF